MTNDELTTFEGSLARCVGNDGFLERFYFLFMATSPEVAAKFKNTDWLRQRRMLVASFFLMMSGKEADLESDAHLSRLATLHGAGHLNIPAHLYDVWLESLLQAVAEYDPMYTDEIGVAWRTTMERGIRLMKSKA